MTKKIIIFSNNIMIWLLFLYLPLIFSQPIKILQFNTTNNILLKGEINEESSSKFIHDLNLLPNKNNTIVYLHTPGGSVTHGMKIVSEIQKYNLSCVAETAYSMGFIILQACKERFLLPHGKLMQHQMALGISDQKSRIESYMNFINQMEDDIISMQTKRINITVSEFKQKINNDWWLYGNNAIEENCADEIVNIDCTETLTKKTETIEKGSYIYTYSKCPLISNHIKREKNKNNDDILFIPFFK